MRIGSQTYVQQSVSAMLDQQARIAKTQNQIASGNKDARAADNPGDVSAALNFDEALSRLNQLQSNGDAVTHRLSMEERALSSLTESLQRVRELVLSANNATQDDATRKMITAELAQRLEELVGIANSDDGQGRYLFAGTQDGTAPFSFVSGGVAYAGDSGSRRIAVTPGLDISDGNSGSQVFLEVPTGNGSFAAQAATTNTGSGTLSRTALADAAQWDGDSYQINFTAPPAYEVRDSGGGLVSSGSYTAGQAIAFRGVQITLQGVPDVGDSFSVAPGAKTDLFSLVQGAVDAFSAPSGGASANAERRNLAFNTLDNLDRALDHVLGLRASVGVRLTAVQEAQDSQASLGIELQKALSEVRDTDITEAAGRLQLQMTALQAAQQTFSRVQSLSLFDYL
jgi:flagellar hook-associated protein 3 FlgL